MLWAVVDIEIFKVPGSGGSYRFNRSYTLIPMELILMKQTNEYSRKIKYKDVFIFLSILYF